MATTQKFSSDMLKRIAQAINEADGLTDNASGIMEIGVAVVDAFNANDLVIIDAKKSERSAKCRLCGGANPCPRHTYAAQDAYAESE